MQLRQQTPCGTAPEPCGDFGAFAGWNLHFLDRLLPLFRRVQRRVRQHVDVQTHGTEALDGALSANQPLRTSFKLSSPKKQTE